MADYSFCHFRIPITGKRVLWQITNVCNYSCAYCIFASGPQKIRGELTTAQVDRAIDSLSQAEVRYIKYTGGEPFVRRDMLHILERTVEYGITCDVSTNASLIDRPIAQSLGQLNLEFVHVSLDGANLSSHEAVRGDDTFDRTLRGISALAQAGVAMRIGTVIHRDNQDSLSDVVESALELGVDQVVFSLMEPMGRMRGDSSQLVTRPLHELRRELVELKTLYAQKIEVKFNLPLPNEQLSLNRTSCDRCPGGTKFLYIDNQGHVSPCTWIVDSRPDYRSEISLRDVSLTELLREESLHNYQSLLRRAACAGSYGCPKSWSTKSWSAAS